MEQDTLPTLHAGKPEKLISDALHMLSACALHHVCPDRAKIVVHQLELIADSQNMEPLLRLTCRQLLDSWENTVRRFAQQIEEERALENLH